MAGSPARTNGGPPVFLPRLLGEAAAASYLGVSQTTLRGLGLPRREIGARRLYDRIDLDAYADALPYEGEERTAGPTLSPLDEWRAGRNG